MTVSPTVCLRFSAPPRIRQCILQHDVYLYERHTAKLQYQLFSQQTSESENDNNNNMTVHEMTNLQTKLLQEASYLTRTLYRKCLQSIKVIAKGNSRDESDFAERESNERKQFEPGSGVNLNERISMAPPVNRQNELSSRANYYKTFTREHFDGHWNLLGAHGFHIGDEGNMRHGLGEVGGGNQKWNQYQGGHHHLGVQMAAQYQGGVGGSGDDSMQNNNGYYAWREEQIEQFVYLIKSGEEKRQWILNDYEFEDPCNMKDETIHRGWSQELEERLKNFEVQSNSLVKEMYQREGWIQSSDYENDSDDDFFSDSDTEDEK